MVYQPFPGSAPKPRAKSTSFFTTGRDLGQTRSPHDRRASSDGPVRLLAAIFPRPDETWFFKLSGPVKAVDDQEKTFQGFIRSVRFSDRAEKPVTWEVPPGWRQEPGRGATVE